jgi:sugar phosphate isomerase/epimerase
VDYAFSTCWNSSRYSDGRAMLAEIRRMGFEHAELSHGIKLSLVEGIQAALKADEIKISTLHNFCPLPLGVMHAAPNIFLLSSTDEAERERAIKQTLKTIEFAVQCRARVIVLHLGRVPMFWNYTERLLKLVKKEKQMLSRYERLRFKATLAREKKKAPYWKQVLRSLDKLVEHARQANVRFGIENRLLLEEIPSEAEFGELFQRYDASVLGYWHDVGHAHVREILGVSTQEQMLDLAGDRLLGFHIHDVGFIDEDHRPPSFGEVMFERLKPYARPDTIKVFEFSPKWRSEDVSQGIEYLKQLWTA